MIKIHLEELMNKISYNFKNENLLIQSLTHRSYVNENNEKTIDNERLEFLGDSVLDLITSEYIYELYSESDEGDLSKVKSKVISETVFSSIARDLDLGRYIFFSNGEVLSGARNRNSCLADGFEALIGAIFLDSDYYTVKKIALEFLKEKIENLDKIEGVQDYKSALQELTQLKYKKVPVYKLIGNTGPDHDKTFEVEVYINNKFYGKARAKTKKNAERLAAKIALKFLKEKVENLDKTDSIQDYKSALQELTQLKYKKLPVYKLVGNTGPDYDKTFEVEVYINNKFYGRASAKSKKNAEKLAAKIALEKL